MEFTTTALNVLIMLAYSVPGFVFVKSKMIDQSHIASFAKVLLYVCSPALSIYSFNCVDYSKELLINLGLFLLLSFVLQIIVLTVMWLILMFVNNLILYTLLVHYYYYPDLSYR